MIATPLSGRMPLTSHRGGSAVVLSYRCQPLGPACVRLLAVDAGAGRLHRRQGSLTVEPALAGPQLLLAVAVMSIALGGFRLARQQRAVGVQVEHVVEFRNVVGRAARLDGPARPRFSALRVVRAGMTQQRCTVSWLQVAG